MPLRIIEEGVRETQTRDVKEYLVMKQKKVAAMMRVIVIMIQKMTEASRVEAELTRSRRELLSQK